MLDFNTYISRHGEYGLQNLVEMIERREGILANADRPMSLEDRWNAAMRKTSDYRGVGWHIRRDRSLLYQARLQEIRRQEQDPRDRHRARPSCHPARSFGGKGDSAARIFWIDGASRRSRLARVISA